MKCDFPQYSLVSFKEMHVISDNVVNLDLLVTCVLTFAICPRKNKHVASGGNELQVVLRSAVGRHAAQQDRNCSQVRVQELLTVLFHLQI